MTDKKDINRWTTYVTRMLRTQRLGCLIDGSITTPPDNEAHLERYKLADSHVTQWMTKQISYTLYKRVKNTNLPIDTAQNLYNSIRHTMLKTSPAEIRMRWKTWVTEVTKEHLLEACAKTRARAQKYSLTASGRGPAQPYRVRRTT